VVGWFLWGGKWVSGQVGWAMGGTTGSMLERSA